ncbi:glycosyltransferase family 2 protein [Aquimarina sp. ERC-38]|uniref:glycosyltransferase family 2 protein n=1 Tax=Aquimarina sp. ERC-38 TaxID=2949996 RepID=UPI0022465C5F|nr:glycosyltransferase family 2 protein [Aquimarina sp. ERC-38]UZO80489.1 glycosyltransferase family 2 protein [Aquimarina sp. ERC-38]
MNRKGVSVLVSTYNWPEALELCLRSLFLQSVAPNEIVVADDGSTNNTKEIIKILQKESSIPIKHIWQEDQGFRLSLIRNKALKQSSYEYIIQIDGDIICHPNFIEDHLLYQKEGYFISGRRCRINKEDSYRTLQNQKLYLSSQSLKQTKLPYKKRILLLLMLCRIGFINSIINKGLRGCNLAYWRKDAFAINGYNTAIEGWGKEDDEFILRMQRNGIHKKSLKFGGIAYHIDHKMNDLSNLKKNEEILMKIKDSEIIVTDKGLE